MTWEEFKEKKYCRLSRRREDWEEDPPGLREFYEDPKANPLKTPTGLLEFYSERLAKHFPDDEERPPIPKWIEKGVTHDERLSQRARRHVPAAAHVATTRAGARTPRATTSPGPARPRPARSWVRTATSTSPSGSTPRTPPRAASSTATSSRSTTSAASCSAAPACGSASCRAWSTSTTAPGTTPSSPARWTAAAPSTPSPRTASPPRMLRPGHERLPGRRAEGQAGGVGDVAPGLSGSLRQRVRPRCRPALRRLGRRGR